LKTEDQGKTRGEPGETRVGREMKAASMNYLPLSLIVFQMDSWLMVNLNFSDFDRFNHLGLFFSALGFLGYI
jgi:hypothetical protein